MIKEQVLKVQYREDRTIITIPKEYSDKLDGAVFMRVWENDKGNIEYEPLKEVK